MTDHLARRQIHGLEALDRAKMHAKLDAIARQFDTEWLTLNGSNPLQLLWERRDLLATGELLNFGTAIEELENIDPAWVRRRVTHIKEDNEGNRSGAIFELLGLSMFLHAGNKVVPAADSNPGYDGTVELPDGSSLVVSVKNHGITTYEKHFRQKARDLDEQLQLWLRQHLKTGLELRISCSTHPDSEMWDKVKREVKHAIESLVGGNIQAQCSKREFEIVLKQISPDYNPLSSKQLSSTMVIIGEAHKNEQKKFVGALRDGCANLVNHTRELPESACRVLFVRISENALLESCKEWAEEYFHQFPNEIVGIIILYQAAIITSSDGVSIGHHLLLVEGPQFKSWVYPAYGPNRRMPDMAVLIGVILKNPSKKVIIAGDRQFALENKYSYQRGDIYTLYKIPNLEGSQFNLTAPSLGVKVHAELETDESTVTFSVISPESDRLFLLP